MLFSHKKFQSTIHQYGFLFQNSKNQFKILVPWILFVSKSVPILELRGVYKKYRKDLPYAVKDLTFSIGHGVFFALVGPNGAGKTTTLHMIMGGILPTRGEVLINGTPQSVLTTSDRAKIGFVPAEPTYYPRVVKGSELLWFKGQLIGLTKAESLRYATDFLKDLDGVSLLDKRIGTLSTGERQKIAFTLAFLGFPSLLILDEPVSHLDPFSREIMYERMKQFVKDGGTILFSSHSLIEVERLAQRIAILHEGILVEDSNLKDLLEEYKSRIIEMTVSDPDEFESVLMSNNIEFTRMDSLFRIPYVDLREDSKKIMKLLCQHGLTIYSMTPSTISLEELILSRKLV